MDEHNKSFVHSSVLTLALKAVFLFRIASHCNMCTPACIKEFSTKNYSLNNFLLKGENFLRHKAVENDLLNCNKSVGTKSKTINQPCCGREESGRKINHRIGGLTL